MARTTTPVGLGVNGRRVWTATTRDYELGEHELAILESACRELDIVDRLEKALKDAKLIVNGSMGQPTANPLLGEVRQHRTTYTSLIKSLKLPESDEATPAQKARSTSARAAAAARWGTGGA